MILITDILKAVNLLLKSKYPTIKIYGKDVKENFDKPSFFVSLITRKRSNDSVNFKTKAYTVIITYHQAVANEIDNLQKADEIIELFGYFLDVKGVKIRIVDDSDCEFVGENEDILQVSVNIEYLEAVERPETSVTAKTLKINEEMR